MQSCSFDMAIPENRRLELTLPDDFPTGAVEVIVLAKIKSTQPVNAEMSLAEFSAWLKEQPSTGRSREEIDAQIAEERDSWGDD